MSLKFDRTVCRTGPSFEHPVRVTYMKPGLPVRVIAETRDHWRRIEDFEGGRCWAHQSTLVALSHALAAEKLDLKRAPKESAPVRARLDRGVIAKIGPSRKGWTKLSVGDISGWARSESLWGSRAGLDPPAVP